MKLDRKLLSLPKEERQRLLKLLETSLEIDRGTHEKFIISILESIVGVKLDYTSRSDKQCWIRKLVAYQLTKEGKSKRYIGALLHRDRSTVGYMIHSTEHALQYPKMYPDINNWYNELQEMLLA